MAEGGAVSLLAVCRLLCVTCRLVTVERVSVDAAELGCVPGCDVCAGEGNGKLTCVGLVSCSVVCVLCQVGLLVAVGYRSFFEKS